MSPPVMVCIDMAQSNGQYQKIIIVGDLNFKNLKWAKETIDLEVVLTAQEEASCLIDFWPTLFTSLQEMATY